MKDSELICARKILTPNVSRITCKQVLQLSVCGDIGRGELPSVARGIHEHDCLWQWEIVEFLYPFQGILARVKPFATVNASEGEAMATASAIHDMSDTIVHLLRTGIPAAMVDPARIFLATPDEFAALQAPGQPHVTIFLYRIAVNPDRRNLPHRTLPNGQITRASLPLELSYLVTAWAKETRDELSIIGQIAQTFYDHCELGAADLRGTGWDSDESVQLILESLPLEDHYRIWDAADVPYRLSLTYVARVVGINPTQVVALAPIVHAQFGATA